MKQRTLNFLFAITFFALAFTNSLEAKNKKTIAECIEQGTPTTVIKTLKDNGHNLIANALKNAEDSLTKDISKLSITAQFSLFARKNAIKRALIAYIEKNF